MIKYLLTSVAVWIIIAPMIIAVYFGLRYGLTTYWPVYVGQYVTLSFSDVNLMSLAASYMLFRLVVSAVEGD